jgi:hypothetical protein
VPKLVDMKRSKKEREKSGKNICTAPYEGDAYGYGLCISLDKEALDKLGLKPSSFDVGDVVTVTARGSIKALRQDKSSSYSSSNVEIQLEKIAVASGGAASAEEAVDEALEGMDE